MNILGRLTAELTSDQDVPKAAGRSMLVVPATAQDAVKQHRQEGKYTGKLRKHFTHFDSKVVCA